MIGILFCDENIPVTEIADFTLFQFLPFFFSPGVTCNPKSFPGLDVDFSCEAPLSVIFTKSLYRTADCPVWAPSPVGLTFQALI